MVKYKELRDDSSRSLDALGKEVDRLRLEVEMAQKGYMMPVEELSEAEEELPHE